MLVGALASSAPLGTKVADEAAALLTREAARVVEAEEAERTARQRHRKLAEEEWERMGPREREGWVHRVRREVWEGETEGTNPLCSCLRLVCVFHQYIHWSGVAAWEEHEQSTPREREEWQEGALGMLAREFAFNEERDALRASTTAVDADKPARRLDNQGHVEGSKLQQPWQGRVTQEMHRQDVEEDLSAATPMTVVMAAISNMGHPDHAALVEQVSTEHWSRAVRLPCGVLARVTALATSLP